jgi:hypothetical protein
VGIRGCELKALERAKIAVLSENMKPREDVIRGCET